MRLLLGGVMRSAALGSLFVCPLSLQKDLVAIVVLSLPAPLTDGAAGVGKEGYQLSDVLHSELQHGGVGGHWLLVAG